MHSAKINTQAFLKVGIVIFVLIVLCIVLEQRISLTIYDERKEILSYPTIRAASIVDQNNSMGWRLADVTISSIRHACGETDDVEAAIAQVRAEFDFGKDYFFLVDDKGKYYSLDGRYGRLADFSPYAQSTPDREEYISNLPHLDQKESFLIFRERLQEPIPVQTPFGTEDIVFVAYAQDFTPIRNEIASLYPGPTNMHIYDSDGIMLLSEFGVGHLIDGYNIYPKFSRCKFHFREKPEELVRKCKDREPFVVKAKIGGEGFYFSSSPLEIPQMSVAFVIHSGFIDSQTENSLVKIVFAILVLAILIGSFIVAQVSSVLKRRATEEKLVESEQLSQALMEASRAKTEFLSNMSHDIRTPINGIIGITTIAKSSLDRPEKVEDCLEKIDTASHHLLSLVNDVLDMSRIERGKTEIVTTPSDIRQDCDNCVNIIRGQLTNRDIDFVPEFTGTHTKLFVDELHLRQILINILGNAVKFTKDGGSIWFRCRETACADGRVTYRFEMEDTGIGMTKEFLNHIFEPFSQEDRGGRSKYNGTGLGMSITNKLVGLMGGTIEVESEPGKGSRFIVDIPFEMDKDAEPDEKPEAALASIQGISILLVEDNELNSEIAVEVLRMNGATVDTAFDGLEAVEKFMSRPSGTFDVILMDIMMPKMNGLDAARRIRNSGRDDARSIPIIAMSANAFEDDVRASLEAGMDAHLSKPIDVSEVISKLSQTINRDRK